MFCSGESGILLARVLTTALSLAFARGNRRRGVREGPGLSAYALEDGTVYRTYVTTARGLEPAMGHTPDVRAALVESLGQTHHAPALVTFARRRELKRIRANDRVSARVTHHNSLTRWPSSAGGPNAHHDGIVTNTGPVPRSWSQSSSDGRWISPASVGRKPHAST